VAAVLGNVGACGSTFANLLGGLAFSGPKFALRLGHLSPAESERLSQSTTLEMSTSWI